MIGKRDRAVLELLARAGLRRSELARLGARRRPGARPPSPTPAVAPSRGDQTQLEAVIRGSKRGRTRTVPLHAEAHDTLRRWYAARPVAATDALFVSLRQRESAAPEPLSPGAVGEIVAKHAAPAGV